MKEEIIKFLEENFNLDNYELPDEYSYSCLPLCLLDAVFSIGANYKSTQNVVDRFCDINNLEKFKSDTSEDYTIKEFIDYIDKTGVQSFAENVIKNTQRTSSTNGILKAEAVLECAKVFERNSIQVLISNIMFFSIINLKILSIIFDGITHLSKYLLGKSKCAKT